MLSGETSHQAVLRVAQGTIGLPAANVLKIKSTATPLRVDGAPVVTMLYFVSSAHPFHDLQSGAGSDASYFNLQTLTNGFAPVQFVLDHRELLRAAAGWLNSKFMTEQLPALFASQVMVDARRPGGAFAFCAPASASARLNMDIFCIWFLFRSANGFTCLQQYPDCGRASTISRLWVKVF